MAEQANKKDVVAARISLETSKIISAFQQIDQLVKSNKANFEQYNVVIKQTEQNLTALAKAMDRAALTTEERRQMILAESQALVAQRQARTKLLEAQMKTELLRQKQINQQIEQEAQRHAKEMARLNQQDTSIFSRAARYALTGALYYQTIQGAREAINVIKEFEYNLVTLQRVMGDTADIPFIKESMIEAAKEYGYTLNEVAEVYTLIGQQGFSEKETKELARVALMAANVEQSFANAAEAQELLTGAVLNYNMAASESERLLDMINEVSNNFPTTSKKLLEGINQTGASAKNAGVEIERLIGYLTVLNQAGFSGAVSGRAIRSFISFSQRDVALEKLEKYVGTIKQANGEMMGFTEILDRIAEKWHQLTDAERSEITQAIARSDQASRFIALMNNYNKALEVATVAENSFGSAQRENALAMSTLEKQALQLKAAWDELAISIGEAGFLDALKWITEQIRLTVEGFNALPDPIRNTIVIVSALGAAFTMLNTGTKLFAGVTLVQLVKNLKNAATAMLGLKTATDAANASQAVMARTPIGAVISGIAVVLGIATVAWSRYKGGVVEAQTTMDQTQRQVYNLTNRYEELQKVLNDTSSSVEEITSAQTELKTITKQLSQLMPDLVEGFNKQGEAIKLNTDKIKEFNKYYKESLLLNEELALKEKEEKQMELYWKKLAFELEQEKIDKGLRQESALPDNFISRMYMGITGKTTLSEQRREYAKWVDEYERLTQEIEQHKKNIAILKGEYIEEEKDFIMPPDDEEDWYYENDDYYKERLRAFNERMEDFRHWVKMEAEGYRTAEEQLARLREIRAEFSDLKPRDLYGIDEQIFELMKGEKTPFELDLDWIEGWIKQANRLVSESQNIIDMFAAQEHRMSDEVEIATKKIQLYEGHQVKLHEANELLRTSLAALHDKQADLNEMLSLGIITQDEYEKASAQIEKQIESLSATINQNSLAWWNMDKAIREANESILKAGFNFSKNWIENQKALREMSTREELAAWIDVASRYAEGTELRLEADKRVFALKKQLMNEELNELDKLVRKQIEYINDVRDVEIEAIVKARDEFLDSQDEKIKAIERQLKLLDELYEDQDYERELAQKQARLAVLQAGVGPEARRERESLLKEIEELQIKRERTLQRRSLEQQKQALEDEREARLKEFEEQLKLTEQHYEELLKPFEKYTGEVETLAETLKQIQIQKENEKNEAILKSLDQFILEYTAKMQTIQSLHTPQELIDLWEYNSNKDRWENAKARGDYEEMARLHARNEYLRQKYGIKEDTGKLDHFQTGGIVKGAFGQPVPIIAHAGEMVLNPVQQYKLFDMIRFHKPSIDFRTPQTVVNYYYNFDNSIGSVAVQGGTGVAGMYDQREGIIARQQALGKKVR